MTRYSAFIYTGSAGERREGDPGRCRAGISAGGRMVGCFHQCRNRPSVYREVDHPAGTYGFCKLHDPVQVALRQTARDHKWGDACRRQQEAWQRQNDTEEAKDRCVEALRQIEAGHNDPRALAREILAKLDVLGGS